MREFEVKQAIIHPDKKDRPQFLFLGAHTDDDAMGKLTSVLDEGGFGLTIGTLTDSSNYDYDLSNIRWQEAIDSGIKGGITEVHRMEAPDGSLRHYTDSGIWFAGNLIDEVEPVGIITPHEQDPHPDHETVFKIGKAVAGQRTPHYTTDTIYGIGKDGSRLNPDMYMELSPAQVAHENTIYLANRSQIVPSKDVKEVFNMTRRRGKEIGVKHAAVAFEARTVSENPLRDVFKGAVSLTRR